MSIDQTRKRQKEPPGISVLLLAKIVARLSEQGSFAHLFGIYHGTVWFNL